jgi:hypothetical protein
MRSRFFGKFVNPWRKTGRLINSDESFRKGRDSSVGTATALRDGQSGDRIPVGARFSAPVQTGPGAYPASYIMGTESFLGVERPGRGVDHPLSSSAGVKERVEIYLYSTSGPLWPVLG